MHLREGELWTCPKCGAKLVGRNMAHACGDYSIDTFLEGKGERARVLFALPAPEQRGAFLRAGFLPTNRTLHFIGKPLAGRLDRDPRAWRFTLGDTDFF